MATEADDNSAPEKVLDAPPVTWGVATSPHLHAGLATPTIMRDVLIGLAPVVLASVVFFGWRAVAVLGLCTLSCLLSERLFQYMLGKPGTLSDFSAAVTGVILGLSLPCTLAPGKPHVCIIAGVAAIGLGKACFGGLGQNIFNPAMAGRSFVMLAFPAALGAGAYVLAEAEPIITMATPLSGGGGAASLLHLAVGKHNGSLGETSGLACVVGGLYLCVRGAAAWEIPASMLITASACAALAHLAGWSDLNAARQLLSGALLFGAFFIATDPVTSPLTFAGKVVFGAAIGLLVMLIRVFGGYPEGVMFAVLVLNAATPLINRLMIPKPVGAQPKPKPAA